MQQFSGIVHNAGRADGKKIYLPLEELKVRALILDVSARVTITQVYSNPADVATSRAKYLFPVPASAAVCAFEMRAEDGRLLVARAIERNQAKETHEKAIREGHLTGLLEVVTDDIFTISVGSIPAKQTVTTTLVYVITLLNDDNVDEVRFHLPMCVGERYGSLPIELENTAGASPHTRIRITVDIQTSGRLQNITSPSHPNDIKETRYPTHLARPSRRRTTVKYKSKRYLERDFLLIIHAADLDAPRCFAEVMRSDEGPDTVALQLTVIPKFSIPRIDAQEYLFLIDRSGSMQGARIESAKDTLGLLLRMLPAGGTMFNIFGFGSKVDSLWPQSVAYSQEKLDTAATHVRSMGANYGGTEILQALQKVFSSRNRAVPTSVFVLTDGYVYDIDNTVNAVQVAVNAAPSTAPLRVFTLGIGDSVSSALCEGVARAGNGVCLFAAEAEGILGKCARLFHAGKTPFVRNVHVDWGISNDRLVGSTPVVDFAGQGPSRTVQLRSPPAIQQSPPCISALHAGTRMSIYAILSLRNLQVPKQVKIEGQLDGSGQIFSMKVKIQAAQLADGDPTLPPIHTLAAWRLIQDHVEGRAPLPQSIQPDATEADIRRAAIVQLGEKYQLASRYTSFVAVDGGQDDTRSRGRARNRDTDPSVHQTGPEEDADSFPTSFMSLLRKLLSASSNLLHWNRSSDTQDIPGAGHEDRSSSPDRQSIGDNESDYESTRTFSTLSTLEDYSDWSDWSRSPSPPVMSEEDQRMHRSPSLMFEPESEIPSDINRPSARPPPPTRPPPAPTVKTEVNQLINLQLYNGSFRLDDHLMNIVGAAALADGARQQVDAEVWATALAIAYMKKHVAGQGELWEKAFEFVRGSYPRYEELISRAASFLS